MAYLPPLVAVRRFGEPLAGALLQPAGVSLLITIQWYALARDVVGRPMPWKGRT